MHSGSADTHSTLSTRNPHADLPAQPTSADTLSRELPCHSALSATFVPPSLSVSLRSTQDPQLISIREAAAAAALNRGQPQAEEAARAGESWRADHCSLAAATMAGSVSASMIVIAIAAPTVRAFSYPHGYRWHSWKNATQMPATIVRRTWFWLRLE